MREEDLSIANLLANELNINVSQVQATVELLDEGATVPFIARYRKEATNGLSDTHLRALSERLGYLRELSERRKAILQSIREQGTLTPALEKEILAAPTKTRLEDLYLPHRPKRRTKASLAKEAGLAPLASLLLANPTDMLSDLATPFINPELGIEQAEDALEGARHILIEQFAEEPNLVAELRQYMWQHGILKANDTKQQKKTKGNKFTDYANHAEAIRKIPSHRALALFRGRREGALQLSISLTNEASADQPNALNLPDKSKDPAINLTKISSQIGFCEKQIARYFNLEHETTAVNPWLQETIHQAWATKLYPKLTLELLARLRESADEAAIRVFATNLRDLLLASPAGPQVTLGLDPGIRTGVKALVVDETGKVLDYTTVFPLAPQNEWHESIASLAKLAAKYHVKLISIGNGTGYRETDRLVTELMKMYPDLTLTKVMVSEAGASVYSASEIGAQEFPDLDVSLRGAVSIARRLQDPLPELVKIDPKSIGVGQYQHDVNQSRLARTLDAVVEDCVNAVGVDLNLASVALLKQVSGLSETMANHLVQYRNEQGAFKNRHELKKVPRFGYKAFQQSAGFLRIQNGENPLDASGVHPEAYPLVEQIIAELSLPINQVIGNSALLQKIDPNRYVNEEYGLPTVQDVLHELEKPGRDPRPAFKTAVFKEGVDDIHALTEGMELEGVVSNVTNFGAFVDIGVHQDGLVHISAMTNRYISDPHTIVKAGDVIRVRVTEVDKERRRIGLSMKLNEEKPMIVKKEVKSQPVKKTVQPHKPTQIKQTHPPKKPVFNTAMADALLKLKRGQSDG